MRCHAVDRPKDRGGAAGWHSRIPRGGRRRMGAVAVVVAGRIEFPRLVGIDTRVTTLAGVVIASPDQFLVAVRRVERFTVLTLPMPVRHVVVIQLAALRTVPVCAGSIREALTLGPDYRIDHAD